MNKILYRYEIEYSNSDGSYTQIRLREYPVIRETERTYFINATSSAYNAKPERQVRKHAINTFAFDTKKEAKEHFIRRTETRVSWYKYWIKECKKGLKLIKDEI